MIQLLIVDDHALIREGLRWGLAESDVMVMAEATDGSPPGASFSTR